MTNLRETKRIDIINNQLPLLTDKDRDIINKLSPYTLIYVNKALSKHIEKKIDLQAQRYINNIDIKFNVGAGLLHALVFNNIIDSIVRDKKINKLFLKMNKPLINVFLSCYTCSILNDGFFSQSNLLKYDKQITPTTIRGYFAELLKLNLIEQAPQKAIYNKTGKLPKNLNTPREIKFYRLTAKGRAEIKNFIKVYTKKHEQITGNIYINDIEKLKTSGFDEDF
jgi:hypothetical protein